MRLTLSTHSLMAGLVLIFAGAAARAQPIAVVNPSFEVDFVPDGSANGTTTGWDTSPGGGDGVFNPSAASYPGGTAPDGQNVAYANEPGNRVRQVLGAVVEANSEYTLQVEVGNRLDVTYFGYRIQLQAAGVVLAVDEATQTPAPGEFVTATLTYLSGPAPPQLGQPIEIWLLSRGTQANFDNVRLTRTTPPQDVPSLDHFGALVLAALLGLLGVGLLRRP